MASARAAVQAIVVIVLLTILAQGLLIFALERFNAQMIEELGVHRIQVQRVEEVAGLALRLHDFPNDKRLSALLKSQAEALPRTSAISAATSHQLVGAINPVILRPWHADEIVYRDLALNLRKHPRDEAALDRVLAQYHRARQSLSGVVATRARLSTERAEFFAAALGVLLLIGIACCGAAWRMIFLPAEGREYETLRRLNESNQRFQALFKNNPDAVFSLDTHGAMVDVNEAAAALLVAAQETVTGEIFRDYLYPDDVEAFEYAFGRAMHGGAWEFDAQMFASDASVRDVIFTLCPILIDEVVLGVQVIARDVSAVRTAEEALVRSERRFRSMFEQSAEGIAAVSLHMRYTRVNAAYEHITGYSGEELVGRVAGGLLVGEDPSDISARLGVAMTSGVSQEFEFILERKDGARRNVLVKTIPILDEGTVDGVYLLLNDVTEQRDLERSAEEQARRIRHLYELAASPHSAKKQIERTMVFGAQSLQHDSAQVLQSLGDGTYVVHSTLDGGIVKAGEAFQGREILAPYVTLSDKPVVIEDARSTEWRNHPVHAKYAIYSYVGATIRVGGKPWGVLSFNSQQKRNRPLHSTDADFVQLMAALIGTAIEREQQQHHLSTMAFYDALTGLPNRTLFAEHASAALARARRDNSKIAVHYVDLDGFKSVNDSFGHSAGDELLRIVAKRLRHVLRESDVVARLSGDEFAYLQVGIPDPESAMTLAKRVVAAINEPCLLSEGVARISASVGISISPEDGPDVDVLLKKADAALYAVKAEGKDGARLYSGEAPGR